MHRFLLFPEELFSEGHEKMIKIKGRAKFLYRQKNGEVFDRVEN